MIARVKFTPNEPRTKDGEKYVDALIILPDESEARVYAREGTSDWDALHNLERGQIIEIETFTIDGRDGTFYRLTEDELGRVLNGDKHPANHSIETEQGPSQIKNDLVALYVFFNQNLDQADTPIEPTAENVQKLAVTAYMQQHNG
jgi:hypothetical protein